MTEEKTLTPEQIMQNRKEHATKTLENIVFQNIVGSGEVMSNQAFYGHSAVQGAKPTYDEAMNSDEAIKVRKELYERKMKEAEGKGYHTYARPSISDYDVEDDIRTQVQENKQILSIGELEEIIKKIDGDLDLEIPDALKKYVVGDFYFTEDGKRREESEFTDVEKAAALFYHQLSKIYDRAAAFKVSKKNRYADLVEPLRKVAEKYKKPVQEA